MRFSRFSLCFVLALPLVVAGCPEAEHHEVHTTKSAPGDEGLIELTWSDATGTPVRAGAAFKIVFTDATAAALTGAAVNLEFIPETEGSAVFVLPCTESAGTPGTYESDAHDFAKAETWHMTVHVVKGEDGEAGHVHDHATFAVAVP